MGDDIEIPLLECGHSFLFNTGAGKCTKCGKQNCSKCLQRIDGKLLCPQCYANFVRRAHDGTAGM